MKKGIRNNLFKENKIPFRISINDNYIKKQ